MNVVLRRCPDCGGDLLGRSGVSWMTCRGCPLALDPFRSPADRLTTFRPDGETGEAPVRLAFYVFEVGPDGKQAWVWIPAFRAIGSTGPDAGDVLTQRKLAPPLVEAPLGAGLARTPAEALVLLKLLQGSDADGAEVPRPRLVSLPCRLSGERVTEPVSGVSVARRSLRPPLAP